MYTLYSGAVLPVDVTNFAIVLSVKCSLYNTFYEQKKINANADFGVHICIGLGSWRNMQTETLLQLENEPTISKTVKQGLTLKVVMFYPKVI